MTPFSDARPVAATLTVAICSPQPIVHAGVHALLASHNDVAMVGLQPDSDAPDPDVVLVDALLVAQDRIQDLRYLIEDTSSTIVVLDRDLRPDLGARAMRLGADGHVPMGADAYALIVAFRSATTREPSGDRTHGQVSTSNLSQERAELLGADLGLTERELSVLERIAQGYRNNDIATELYLSENSIKTYIRSAYRRIGVTSRSEAVRWAITHGLDYERSDAGSSDAAHGFGR